MSLYLFEKSKDSMQTQGAQWQVQKHLAVKLRNKSFPAPSSQPDAQGTGRVTCVAGLSD